MLWVPPGRLPLAAHLPVAVLQPLVVRLEPALEEGEELLGGPPVMPRLLQPLLRLPVLLLLPQLLVEGEGETAVGGACLTAPVQQLVVELLAPREILLKALPLRAWHVPLAQG